MRIDELLDTGDDLIRLRDYPWAESTIRRAIAGGRVAVLLPGVYCRAGRESSAAIRLRGACLWSATGVIHGLTAAQLYFKRPVTYPIQLRAAFRSDPAPWLKVSKGAVGDVVTHGSLRLASAVHACVELAAEDRGEAVFEGLRRRLIGANQLVPALAMFERTPGNPTRKKVVRSAARNPWSFAEAQLQQLLIGSGITSWVANEPLWVLGRMVAPDLLLPEHRLVIEFDGEAAHSGHDQFEDDRSRQNLLVLAGYRVLRFTWNTLTEHPQRIVSTVTAAIEGLPPEFLT